MGFGGSASAMNVSIRQNRKAAKYRKIVYKSKLDSINRYVFKNTGIEYTGKRYKYEGLSDDYLSRQKLLFEVGYYIMSSILGLTVLYGIYYIS